jgi:hypothetical protein
MKLGIAYNIYDGQEMLPFAVENLRFYAHKIFVIYQEVSNFGNRNPDLMPMLKELESRGLVDKLIPFTPSLEKNNDGSINWKSGCYNEIKKRQLGLEVARVNGCDTYMTLDCDELYDCGQFKWAMEDFERGGYDTSFTKLLTYYKKPTLQVTPPETWYQPLFYKIKKDTEFVFINEYPVNTDQTKKVKAGHCRVYKENEIIQHHFAYVRHNLNSKVINSSSQSDKKSQEEVIYHFDNWKGVKDGALFNGGKKFGLKEVENIFKIDITQPFWKSKNL